MRFDETFFRRMEGSRKVTTFPGSRRGAEEDCNIFPRKAFPQWSIVVRLQSEQSCNNFAGETLPYQSRFVTLGKSFPGAGLELQAAMLKVTLRCSCLLDCPSIHFHQSRNADSYVSGVGWCPVAGKTRDTGNVTKWYNNM